MSIQLKNPVTAKDHIQGLETAPLELVEYGDYQCPSCGEANLIIKSVQQQLGKQVKFVFRNFPLEEHPNAFGAAMAAEAAALQHRFWEMHDLLYSNRLYLGNDDLFGYAEDSAWIHTALATTSKVKRLPQKLKRILKAAKKAALPVHLIFTSMAKNMTGTGKATTYIRVLPSTKSTICLPNSATRHYRQRCKNFTI